MSAILDAQNGEGEIGRPTAIVWNIMPGRECREATRRIQGQNVQAHGILEVHLWHHRIPRCAHPSPAIRATGSRLQAVRFYPRGHAAATLMMMHGGIVRARHSRLILRWNLCRVGSGAGQGAGGGRNQPRQKHTQKRHRDGISQQHFPHFTLVRSGRKAEPRNRKSKVSRPPHCFGFRWFFTMETVQARPYGFIATYTVAANLLSL